MAEQNQELRKAGLKITLPRVKILQILESSELKSQHLLKAKILCLRPVYFTISHSNNINIGWQNFAELPNRVAYW